MTTPPISPMQQPTAARLGGGLADWRRPTLLTLAALATLLGVTQVGAALAFAEVAWPTVLFTCVFLLWVAAGITAWWRRPRNGVGQLIVVGGIAMFLGGIGNVPAPLFQAINAVCATSVLAVTVHILHAFPSGRLHGTVSRSLVVLAYLTTMGGDIAKTVTSGWHRPLYNLFDTGQSVLGLLVMVATAALLSQRLIAADAQHRRVLLPMGMYGIITVVLVPLTPYAIIFSGMPQWVSGVIQLGMLAGLPIAFLLGVLLGGFKRTTALDALTAWLAVGGSTRAAVGTALAETLGDDSLCVLYWSAEQSAYVDATGHPVARSAAPDPRGWIDVRVEERLVGAISYDTRLIANPYSVRRVGEVLAIAIDRERLTAELLASNEELSRSRMRLVETAYQERSRIARDLHDGVQAQLVLLAIEAQSIARDADPPTAASAAAERLRHGIDATAAELRNVVHNVLPVGLIEQGLVAATEDLLDRVDLISRLDADDAVDHVPSATAHTAYFVLAELLTNAVKHARASRVVIVLSLNAGNLVVRVSDDGVGGAEVGAGTGLRGLTDRITACGGSLSIASAAAAGTQVRVELPCA